jgi:hypothetical protein
LSKEQAMTRTLKSSAWVAALAVAGAFAPSGAAADVLTPQAYAVRTGISIAPDQFTGGLQLQLGTSTRPQIRPTVEAGFGNGVRLFSFGGDVLYHFEGRRWRPYAGGGPGLNLIDVTDGVGESDGMTAKLVAHLVTGLGWTPGRGRHRYFVEGKFGIGDTPDVRVAVGMSF